MSDLIDRGLPCPHCHSSDARAEYEDNFYCFSCHAVDVKKKSSNYVTKESLKELTRPQEIELPKDATPRLPDAARAWLYSHHFTDAMIHDAKICYSEHCIVWSQRKGEMVDTGARIILPYYRNHLASERKLIFFEARTLDKKNKLKYATAGGKKDCYFSNPYHWSPLVIVEDILSAIRVGHSIRCVSIRGTSINTQRLLDVVNGTSEFILWLDSDKPGQDAARKWKNKLSWAGSVRNIVTEKDPKCYSDKEIQEILK